MNTDKVRQLRAIEAFRAGVPSRYGVLFFPPRQEDVESRWENSLEAAAKGEAPPGVLLEGDFGTGKSHWLEYLRQRAREANFVCSTVVLNKETPLHDANKLLRAAVECAALPSGGGPALDEIAFTYKSGEAPGYSGLSEWIHGPERDPRLALSLQLFGRTPEEEIRQRVIEEWSGYPMPIGEFRLALKGAGITGVAVPKPRRDNALEKLEFLARFFRSAGYAGWALLLDEAEMISRYSLRQRGRSYGHLARLLGAGKNGVAGLACAATITKDYAGQVLHGRKNDKVNVPAKMEGTRDEALAAPALAGMRLIERGGTDLRPPGAETVNELFERARQLYSEAYEWSAPPLPGRREYSASTSLRQHLRWWINAWDLLRLYGHQGETIVESVTLSYDEDSDLQTETGQGEPRIVL